MSQIRADGGALVVFPGALGDFVCFLPALEALRERHRNRVAILCAAWLGDLARLAGVAEVHAIEGREASWLFAASPPPEADAFYRRFSAIECFTGFGVAEVERNLARWGSGRVHRFRPIERLHFTLHCLRSIGLEAESPPRADLPVVCDAEAFAAEPVLNRAAHLVVHPGSGGLAKRWSRIGFRAVLEAWRREIGDVEVLLGPAEAAEASTWAIEGVSPIIPANVVELARRLRRTGLYLGNDSGASHLAAAVGGSGIALFGPSDEVRWAPLGPRLHVLRPTPWTALDAVPPAAAIRQVFRGLRDLAPHRSP